MRPISNVVDITNYVMLALGNPLHAFDLDTLAGGRIVVRRASRGERMRTLDGEPYALALPRGLWGTVEERLGLRLLPVGYRVVEAKGEERAA